MESAHALKKKKLTTLSVQEIIDCSTPYGNIGCNGGTPDYVYNYIIDLLVSTDADYPYTGSQGRCWSSKTTNKFDMKRYRHLSTMNVEGLRQEVDN